MKTKIRTKMHGALRYFAVYGVLPALSLMFLALLFTVRAVGAGRIGEFLEKSGDAALFALTGATARSEPESAAPSEASPAPSPAETAEPPEETETEEAPSPALRHFDAVPEGAVAVVAADLTGSGLINTTQYAVDLAAARETPFPARTAAENGEPLVLILHTHATESYLFDDTDLSALAPEGVETYYLPSEQPFRTTDNEKNVVAVGEEFAAVLISRGIPTLHCAVQHDAEDFNSAYVSAAETIRRILAEHPSIEYVIDLHRDSIARGEDRVKTVCTVDGEPSAQVMLVVGTNQLGRHPNWLQNLAVQVAYKDVMDARYPHLSRSLYLRTARFNQEYRTGSMLLEVGSSANTLEEAKTAARAAAECLADLILSHR